MTGAATIRLAPSGATFACRPGETILRAGLAAGLAMPYECASGGCGSCKARLLEGAVESLWPEATGLKERDRRRGDRILCCQALPQGDCVVETRRVDPTAAAPTAAAEPAPEAFTAAVERVERLNDAVLFLRCRRARPRPFLPGQFMLLQIPGGQRRAFSMANTAPEVLEFIVKAKPGGHATGYLFERLSVGDGLRLEGPYGRACLRAPLARDILCVAGGSGLAPMLSVARGALARPGCHAVRLFFGVNAAADLFATAELEALAAANDRLALTLAVRDGAPGAATGLVGDVMLAALAAAPVSDLYMAGPPGLVDALLKPAMRSGKIAPGRIFFDRFY